MTAARSPREQSSLFDLDPEEEGDEERQTDQPEETPATEDASRETGAETGPLDLPLRTESEPETSPAEAGRPEEAAGDETGTGTSPVRDRLLAGLL
ncbi:MAG: hypothetical protein R3234_09680, partial [Thermoanaerobaculia bacterium]|nr:hypothetical protein [Thermoanaerobaculia bacterium]